MTEGLRSTPSLPHPMAAASRRWRPCPLPPATWPSLPSTEDLRFWRRASEWWLQRCDPGSRSPGWHRPRHWPPAPVNLARRRRRSRRPRSTSSAAKQMGLPATALWRFDPADGQDVAGRSAALPDCRRCCDRGWLHRLPDRRQAVRRELLCASVVLLHEEHTVKAPAEEEAEAASAKRSTKTGPPPPFVGRLLIADRGNNRLLVVNAHKKILWRYPSKTQPGAARGLLLSRRRFLHPRRHADHLQRGAERAHRPDRLPLRASCSGPMAIPHVAGSEPGYLHEPDDAYLLRDGTVTVADAQNCRLLLIAPTQEDPQARSANPRAANTNRRRRSALPTATRPCANGNILVSEVNGSYIDEITPAGKLVWSVQLPIEYPSDPQQLGPRSLPRRRLLRPRRPLRVQPRWQDPLVLPSSLTARGCSTIRAWPSAFPAA